MIRLAPWWAGKGEREPRGRAIQQPASHKHCCWFCFCLSLGSAATRPGRQRPFSVPAAGASGKHRFSVESATCGLKENLTPRKTCHRGDLQGTGLAVSRVLSQPGVRATAGPPAPQASTQQPSAARFVRRWGCTYLLWLHLRCGPSALTSLGNIGNCS